MSVAVIIPTHNRVPVLARALDSVLHQETKPGEIIVVDDGSTDDTAVLMETGYPSVCYVRQPNAGVSAARNGKSQRPAANGWPSSTVTPHHPIATPEARGILQGQIYLAVFLG